MFHLMSCLCLDKLASCVNMKETETEYEWIFPPQQTTAKSFSLQNNIIQIHFFSFSKILQWPCYSVSWVGTWICCKIQSANWNILHNFVVLLLGDSLTAIMWRNNRALTKYVFRHICHFYFTIHKGVRVYIQNWKFFLLLDSRFWWAYICIYVINSGCTFPCLGFLQVVARVSVAKVVMRAS